MNQSGTGIRWARGVAVVVLGFGMAACDQIEGFEMPAFLTPAAGETGTNNLAPTANGTGEGRDVEAPEVFQKTEAGLWDGRPSLGGVWVAHPDVDDPERVIIRNEDNGRFVVGALFRRERDNPGPSLQVSSDAAEELGMLAGAPARLNVIALRRADVAPEPAFVPDDVSTDEAETALAPPDDIASTPLDAIGEIAAPAAAPTAVAAIDAAADAAPDLSGTVQAITAAANAAPAPAAPLPPLTAPTSTPAASSSTIDAIAGAAAAVAAAEAEAGLESASTVAAPLTDAVSSAPLDARGAIEAPIPLPEPVTSGLEKPFVQVGIFSVESNANDAADTLRRDGISARVLQQDSAGTAFWRVLVGPAPNAQDRTAILAKVQALGFNDAYFVSN